MVTEERDEKEELDKDTVKDLWKDNRSGERFPEGLIHVCSCGRNWWDEEQKVGHLFTRMRGSLIHYLTSGLWEV